MIKSPLGPILWVLAFLAAPVYADEHEHHHHHDMEEAAPSSALSPSTESVYNLNADWTAQDGKTVRLGAFAGRPVVLAMMYSRCKEMCPLTIEQIRKIKAEVERQSLGEVQYVLASFDAKRDTPKHLKQFAAERGLEPEHWTLLHGAPAAIRELAAVLGISYRQAAGGEFDHSYAITLLNKEGVVVMQQTGLQPDTKEFVDRIAGLHLDQR